MNADFLTKTLGPAQLANTCRNVGVQAIYSEVSYLRDCSGYTQLISYVVLALVLDILWYKDQRLL